MNIKTVDIKSVECIGEFEDEYVYDIEMENPHIFFANDILVHNSSFFNIQPLVDDLIGKDSKFTKKNINIICKELDGLTDKMNDFCFNDIVKKKLFSNLDRISFKRETFSTEGAFLIKKRYILHVRDDEGIPKDTFKYVGVDIKKTEIPIKLRHSLKDVVEKALKENWTNNDYYKYLNNLWKEFKNMKIEDIAIHKGYSTPKESDGFLSMEKGAGLNAKAAHYYNQLIDKFKLLDKYDKIRLGDRLRYCYIKDNSYKIKVIGFLEIYPEEFKELFLIDYKLMFEKTILSPLKLFCHVQGWREIDPTIDPVTSIFDL